MRFLCNNLRATTRILSGPYSLGCLAGRFYVLQYRIWYKIYFEPLIHTLSSHVQLRAKQTAHSHISLCKWGNFERAKTTLKMLLDSWFLVCFFKRFRCLNAKNLGSVGQRAAKLLAVKVGGLNKSLPAGPGPSQPVCSGSIPGHGPIILKVWWLVTLQPIDLQTPNFQH